MSDFLEDFLGSLMEIHPTGKKGVPQRRESFFTVDFEGRKVGVVLLKYLSAKIQRAYLWKVMCWWNSFYIQFPILKTRCCFIV